MDTSNLCTKCGADNLRDSYFCAACDEADVVNFLMSRTATQQRTATIARLCNLAADDDGEPINSRIEEFERVFFDENVRRRDLIDEVLTF